jgi:hypothetical protein
MDFTEVEYEYTRRMNLLIDAWDVPSVNFLGAVDAGTGKWAKGFWYDSLHPNASGHDELTTTFVPSLFEALDKGKPAPVLSTTTGFTRAPRGAGTIAFAPTDKMHPFALSLQVRAQSDGVVGVIDGLSLVATTATKKIDRGNRPAVEIEETTLTPGPPFTATLGVHGGTWTYTAGSGQRVISTVKADALWHSLVVSHYTARGETLFFVDGRLAGVVTERLEPKRFVVGGPTPVMHASAPKQTDVKELMIYRSALNADEVSAMSKGVLLQSSLEVYAPLADAKLDAGAALENRAQSLALAKVEGSGLVHLEK